MDTIEKHPLLQKPYARVRDWRSWKKLWDEAQYTEQLVGLLHIAFDFDPYGLSREDWNERLRLLLRLADGHDAADYTWTLAVDKAAGDDWSSDTKAAMATGSKTVAEKAFKMLCDRFFKPKDRSWETPAEALKDEETFETVLWFFCDHDRRKHGRNLPLAGDDRHHAKIARQYVHDLIEGAWSLELWWQSKKRTSMLEEQRTTKFAAARSRSVVLLHDLGELHFLYNDVRRADEPALDALRKLALFEDGKQKYRTAEEAIGTYAGRSLLIVEAALREADRQARIEEAARRKRQAERDLEDAQKG